MPLQSNRTDVNRNQRSRDVLQKKKTEHAIKMQKINRACYKNSMDGSLRTSIPPVVN